ncbi:MAG: OmpA family protein [Proteobacteria bacterium]|jgi:outer membrane protein OmpA-like peptidoglycan-associated protein|nr:OmpA family protein [Pseudomonadota bacterium]
MTAARRAEARGIVRLAALGLVVLVAGCATPTGTVVLLPAQDGHHSVLSVKGNGHEVLLDKPYAAAETTTQGPRAYESSKTEVEKTFGSALAAQPARLERYTLFFTEGTDALTDESKATFDRVFPDIAKRSVPDIVVIGHTDSTGSDPLNDRLSLQRANAIRDEMIRRGIPAADIVAEGRGKREPLVKTAEGVAEAKNRRVEIIVR